MQNFRTCLGALVRETRPVSWKILISVLIGTLRVAASLAFVWISKRVVDIATGRLDEPLDSNVMTMALIMLAQISFIVALHYWEEFIQIKYANHLRSHFFRCVMQSTWTGKDKFHSGDTVNRIIGDINEIAQFVCVNLPQCAVTLLQMIAATFFLYKLSPSLMWVLLLVMPVAILASRFFFRTMRRLTGEIRAQDSAIQGHIQENILHRTIVRTLGATPVVTGKLSQMQSILQEKSVRRLGFGAFSRLFMHLGFATGYALAFFWGVYGLHDGTVTYGIMVAFLQLVGQIQRPVADITRHIPAFIMALTSEERLMELDALPKEIHGEETFMNSVPGIRIKNLAFTYDGSIEPVIKDFSYDFKPGSLTVISGKTGAGKSTLIRLILSLLKPDCGIISVYDKDKEYIMNGNMLCNFRYVPQGNTLMSGTIRQNLLLAKPDATDEELLNALHLAAADFVMEFPASLDTSCAEVGAGISEGQAQRIAVARALLRSGGILILDEATSSLDESTELELLTNLSLHYHGNKTIICITHRPAARMFADNVLEM